MCGISGTIVKKNYNPGKKVRPEELSDMVNNLKNGNKDIDRLLEKVWEYKSNVNFIRYVNNKAERKLIKIIANKINDLGNNQLSTVKKIDKQSSPQLFVKKYEEYEKLKDCYWFLSHEIREWYDNFTQIILPQMKMF